MRAEGKQVLVPLTNSLYVKGSLSSESHVIVDVGTGFYVEKDIKSAAKFYGDKTTEISNNVKDLDSIIQGKTNNVRLIEEGRTQTNLSFLTSTQFPYRAY